MAWSGRNPGLELAGNECEAIRTQRTPPDHGKAPRVNAGPSFGVSALMRERGPSPW
jgi:hypothetical protein